MLHAATRSKKSVKRDMASDLVYPCKSIVPTTMGVVDEVVSDVIVEVDDGRSFFLVMTMKFLFSNKIGLKRKKVAKDSSFRTAFSRQHYFAKVRYRRIYVVKNFSRWMDD
jgi:hypothetical protein